MKCKFCEAEVVVGKACDYCGSVAEYSYYGQQPPSGPDNQKQPERAKRQLIDGKYTVQKGDSLFAISREFYGSGWDYYKIVRANRIKNPDLIFPGQVLKIPTQNRRSRT